MLETQKQPEEASNKRIAKQPFFKNNAISFVKVGHCHMCKSRNKIGYQCFRNYQATSC